MQSLDKAVALRPAYLGGPELNPLQLQDIPPFLGELKSRGYAACARCCFGERYIGSLMAIRPQPARGKFLQFIQ